MSAEPRTGRRARCPMCREPAAVAGKGSPFPFCSARCQLVDLGHWLDEDYRISPVESEGYQNGPALEVDE